MLQLTRAPLKPSKSTNSWMMPSRALLSAPSDSCSLPANYHIWYARWTTSSIVSERPSIEMLCSVTFHCFLMQADNQQVSLPVQRLPARK